MLQSALSIGIFLRENLTSGSYALGGSCTYGCSTSRRATLPRLLPLQAVALEQIDKDIATAEPEPIISQRPPDEIELGTKIGDTLT